MKITFVIPTPKIYFLINQFLEVNLYQYKNNLQKPMTKVTNSNII